MAFMWRFLGISGGIIAAVGIIYSSLYLLALGTFCVGAYQSFAQFYRFAASEVADDTFVPVQFRLLWRVV